MMGDMGFQTGLGIVLFGAALMVGGFVFGVFEDALPCSDRSGYVEGTSDDTALSLSTGSAKQCLSLNNNVWTGLNIAGIGVIFAGLFVIFAPVLSNRG